MALMFALLILPVPASTTELQPITRNDIAYGRDPAELLDVCLPAGEVRLARAVLLIHGGGWAGGDKRGYVGTCRRAAALGLVAFAVNYRLVDGPKGPVWPAPLIDVQLAVRWVRAHAVEFGVDPGKVCALGDSAGGQLATMLAAIDTVQPGDREKEFANVSPKVDCAVTSFGPADFTGWVVPAAALERIFGTLPPDALLSAKRTASPLSVVDAHTAPMMIIQGSADTLIPPVQAAQLYQKLRQDGVRVSLLVLPCDHEFKGLPPEQAAAVVQLELAFLQTSPLLSH